MPVKVLPYGARTYHYSDGVILVKQTVKNVKTGRYVIDTDASGNHKEKHVDPGNVRALGEAVRLAGLGKL